MSASYKYRYNSFTLPVLLSDMRFNGGVKPGSRIEKIKLNTTNGEVFEWPRAGSPRLMLLIMGSRTCPATVSTIPDIKTLYKMFGQQVEFVYLYVREAHPGDQIRQPQTLHDKTVQACALRSEYAIPWKIAVDTIDGSVHHQLATRPNAVYLIDADGVVVFRTLFAADSATIREAIRCSLAGLSIKYPQRNTLIYPILKLIGVMWEVLARAGKSAQRDLLVHTPFIYVPSIISAKLRRLTAFERGVVSMLITLAVPVLLVFTVNQLI